jgi:hypothetical protein
MKSFNAEQQKIIDTIRTVAGKHYTTDMTKEVPDSIFYTPEEWKDRGEEYGLSSKLIVTHEGDALAPFFNLDYGAYGAFDEMIEAFDSTPYWSEGCTCWYSCFYLRN